MLHEAHRSGNDKEAMRLARLIAGKKRAARKRRYDLVSGDQPVVQEWARYLKKSGP